jgi:hypothetical protein
MERYEGPKHIDTQDHIQEDEQKGTESVGERRA